MNSHHFLRSKFSKIMSLAAFNKLDILCQSKQKLPEAAKIPTSRYWSGKGSNLLTATCISYLKWHGYHAERTGNTGQMRRMKDGSMKYTFGAGTNGTSDIKAVIDGEFIAIEVKFNKDKMSPAQLKYQHEIEKAGGIYLIVKTLDDLLEYFDKNKITKTKIWD